MKFFFLSNDIFLNRIKLRDEILFKSNEILLTNVHISRDW